MVAFAGNMPVKAAANSSPKSFIVTAYCQHGITKSGLHTGPGIAAGDPSYLPLGSLVSVATGPADASVYTVADTGSKVKGEHLDVFTPDCGRAKQFGRKLLQLTILRVGWHVPRLTGSFSGRTALLR
jgi:3D (Asp-Asp-Asp) domain-containing protein